jgi:hypothetical protein
MGSQQDISVIAAFHPSTSIQPPEPRVPKLNVTRQRQDLAKLESQNLNNNECNNSSNPKDKRAANMTCMSIRKQHAQGLPNPDAEHRQKDANQESKEDAENDEEPCRDPRLTEERHRNDCAKD